MTECAHEHRAVDLETGRLGCLDCFEFPVDRDDDHESHSTEGQS